ncbi:MAG TPA: hypothetical protein ENI19_00015 [Candidatus Nealsonbacteria bacterium]|nr:hypothetical protein [Candidatus Nealsonbacteria bacterium]HEB46092.1 hypothetical protein [Candidatus Nealsonbacteria bacterium]
MTEIVDSSKERAKFYIRIYVILAAVFLFFLVMAILMVTGTTETRNLTASYGILAISSFMTLFSLWRMTIYLRVLLEKEKES